MKVLFIGGTGIISSACSELAVLHGVDLYLLNRGQSFRPIPDGVHTLKADIRKPETVSQAIRGLYFDAVVDWIAFTPEHVKIDLDLFRERSNQYIFISSASAYQKPPARLPITESTILDNPFWQYSREKIACEYMLMQAYHTEKFPVTIVRPSHTYDRTLLPIQGGWTTINRMMRGNEVIVHGDGTSLWTLTHHKDFALGFYGLLGNLNTVGEAFHITSDEWLSWNQIFETVASAAGIEPKIIHIPSDTINAFDPEWGAGLLGDKAHCGIFDNSKIKQYVPAFHASISFSQGAKEIIAWYKANPELQKVDEQFNARCDQIIEAQKKSLHS